MLARVLLVGLVGMQLLACGTEPRPEPQPTLKNQPASRQSGDEAARQQDPRFDPSMQTPGFFRDMARLLAAQSLVDDDTAVHRLLVELPARIAERGTLPDMLDKDVATLDGLLILALRSVQATEETRRTARIIGENLLVRTLALDPARLAWNRDHPDAPAEVLSGGAAALASAGLWAVEYAAAGTPFICAQSTQSAAEWDPGDSEIVWVDEVCYPDLTVGGYCENDRWVEGDCYDVWVPENCSGGDWEDNGYYEYYCYGDGDCRYEWRSRWEYVEGYCDGGYYEEECYPGYWEEGMCYDGTFVPGYCDAGHYEYRFPGGTWHFAAATAPLECSSVRPSQLAIAATSAQVLHAEARADLQPEWQAALDSLIASDRLQSPDEAFLDGVLDVLGSAM